MSLIGNLSISWPWVSRRLAQDDRDEYGDRAQNLPGIQALIKDHPTQQSGNDRVEEAYEGDRARAEPAEAPEPQRVRRDAADQDQIDQTSNIAGGQVIRKPLEHQGDGEECEATEEERPARESDGVHARWMAPAFGEDRGGPHHDHGAEHRHQSQSVQSGRRAEDQERHSTRPSRPAAIWIIRIRAPSNGTEMITTNIGLSELI